MEYEIIIDLVIWERTYRLERLNLLRSKVVFVEIELGIVDSNTTGSTVGASKQRRNILDWNTNVRAVGGVLEEHGSSPVVAEVIRHLACCASPASTNITRHVGRKSISADNVMNMRGRGETWLNDGVEALSSQL